MQTVREDARIGDKVFTVLAEDGDRNAQPRNAIRYTIDANEYFDIDSNTGVVFVSGEIDRESVAFVASRGLFNLSIEVRPLTTHHTSSFLIVRLSK